MQEIPNNAIPSCYSHAFALRFGIRPGFRVKHCLSVKVLQFFPAMSGHLIVFVKA